MRTTLVTGASGNLGSTVVKTLLGRGQHVRAHMRSPAATVSRAVEPFYGDLRGGEGLGEAAHGADAIIHCASYFDADGSTDRLAISHLIEAAEGAPHLVYISIVGVDRTAFPYFRTKLEVERAVAASKLPHTIMRATQFHDFVGHLIAGFDDPRAETIALPPELNFQSIGLGDVAMALVTASEGPPVGRVSDLAGPQILTLHEMADRYARLLGMRRTIKSLGEDPQQAFHDSFRDGRNLAPHRAVGRVTWDDFLTAKQAEAIQPIG